MRLAFWGLILFVLAVAAATFMGANDGLVSIYWAPWRVDLSVNLLLLILLLTLAVGYVLLRAADLLTGLPRRASAWRAGRTERKAQRALREGWAELSAGRYPRAHRAAEQALAGRQALILSADTSATTKLAKDRDFVVLAHTLAAASMHHLQDRTRRDEHVRLALEHASSSADASASSVVGLRLMTAEWALEDRDAEGALQSLQDLPRGVARRPQTLRLRLQAARLARDPMEALRTARLLAKLDAPSPTVGPTLQRTLAIEGLATARDADQLSAVWQQLEPSERRDPFVAAQAALRMARMGGTTVARQWLRPHWEAWSERTGDERAVLCEALAAAVDGIETDWLQRIERAQKDAPQDPWLACVAGRAFEQAQLWGKARRQLETAAQALALPAAQRRDAWRRVAVLAEQAGEETQAHHAYRQAAQLD